MFQNLIDRLGTNLNLPPNEALKSELIKELCSNLVHGHVVVVDTNRNEVFAIKDDTEILEKISL